jgi:hypothetical protein
MKLLTNLLIVLFFLALLNPVPIVAAEKFVSSNFYPPNGKYYSSTSSPIMYMGGNIQIRKIVHRDIPHVAKPPALGDIHVYTFTTKTDIEISFDAGAHWNYYTELCNNSVRLNHTQNVGDREEYATDYLQMDIASTSGPYYVRIRESPTLASTSTTTIRSVTGGYQVDSFFDIFTEVSIDGGATWMPGDTYIELGLNYPPEYFIPSALYPPKGKYLHTDMTSISFYGGTVQLREMEVRNLNHVGALPALGNNISYPISASFDCELSTNGGTNWLVVHSPAQLNINLNHIDDDGTASFFERNLSQLDVSGGNLPSGFMIRESPTKASLGKYNIRGGGGGGGGGYMVSSFFDIFTELTMDGGQTWSPGNTYSSLELYHPATSTYPSPNYPPPSGRYVSKPDQWITWPSGIIIENLVNHQFTQSFPPPPPGGSATNTFGGNVAFRMYLPTMGWSDYQAPVSETFQITSTDDDGSTRFFNKEVLAFNVSGGNLPAGCMIRESPTKQSTGRLHEGLVGGQYEISSFFDIFTEISLDGGMTWSPSTDKIYMELYQCPTITLNPSGLPNGTKGLYYDQTVTASGGTAPYTYMTISGNLPNGLGISTSGEITGTPTRAGSFNCTIQAQDAFGCTGTKEYTVIVELSPEYHFAASCLPPANGKYATLPQTWFASFASGIIIKDMVFNNFSNCFDLPTLGNSQSNVYTGNSTFEISFDGGNTFIPVTAPASFTSSINHTQDGGSVSFFDTEMLSLTISGGGLPPGVYIRESPTLVSPGQSTVRSDQTGYMISSFFDVFTEISTDFGVSYVPTGQPGYVQLSVDCSPISLDPPVLPNGNYGQTYNQTIVAGGGVPPYNYTVASGNLPNGLDLSPSGVLTGIPSKAGLFNFTVQATDMNGCSGTEEYSVMVKLLPEYSFVTNCLPPPSGKYVDPQGSTVMFLNGIIIRHLVHDQFSDCFPPPAIGFPAVHGYSGRLLFEISLDGGITFIPASSPTSNTFFINHTQDSGATSFFDTEMLAMNVGGGTIPVWIRESPTLPSLGQTTIRTVESGYMISSFFDVFFEISFDGGSSWTPTMNSAHLSLIECTSFSFDPQSLPNGTKGITYSANVRASGGTTPYTYSITSGNLPHGLDISSDGLITGTPQHIGLYTFTVTAEDYYHCLGSVEYTIVIDLKPEVFCTINYLLPDKPYFSNATDSIVFAPGIVIKNLKYYNFSQSIPPPAIGAPAAVLFTGSMDYLISLDGGLTYNPGTTPTTDGVHINHVADADVLSFFDTEMMQLDISGGGLPGSVYIRESPTKASVGQTVVRAIDGGYKIASFFDIYFELSTDGGLSWFPALQPIRIYLVTPPMKIDFSVAGGWNILSVPLTMEDYAKIQLYPTSISNAFVFDGNYVSKDTLDNGIGFWLKFPKDTTLTLEGIEIVRDTFNVFTGWNMIGSISSSVPVSSVIQEPANIVVSAYYEYDNGYKTTSVIASSKGCWVKVNQKGMLILNAPTKK